MAYKYLYKLRGKNKCQHPQRTNQARFAGGDALANHVVAMNRKAWSAIQSAGKMGAGYAGDPRMGGGTTAASCNVKYEFWRCRSYGNQATISTGKLSFPSNLGTDPLK